jgi:hypothetical protein
MTEEATAEAITEDQAPAAAPMARIVTDRPMSKIVPLEWPVEFDGIVYRQIRVKRVTGGEVRDYFEKLRAGEAVMPPMIECPLEVWEALDADDQSTIDEAVAAFVPKRMKMLQQAAAALDAAGA